MLLATSKSKASVIITEVPAFTVPTSTVGFDRFTKSETVDNVALTLLAVTEPAFLKSTSIEMFLPKSKSP